MGILGTKSADGRTTQRKSKERKPKPDELLSSVVRETAPAAAFEMLRANSAFTMPSGTAHVVILVDASTIGGLSKRHTKDEAKGQLIQMIGADRIHTVAHAEMLAEDTFGIIPDQESLQTVSEFSLITSDAVLGWGVIYPRADTDGLIVDSYGRVDFGTILAVHRGEATLQEVVPENLWQDHSGQTAAAQASPDSALQPAENLGDMIFGSPSSAVPATEQVPVFTEDPGDALFDQIGQASASPAYEQPVFADEPVFEDQPVFDEPAYVDAQGSAVSAASPVYASPVSAPEPEVAFHVEDEHEDEIEQYAEVSHEGDVILEDENQAESLLARRFLSEELDLEVDLVPFERTFRIASPSVALAVPEAATEWLGDQVAHLTRQANSALAQLHATHQDTLRTRYVSLMSRLAEQIIREVDPEREGSKYKAMSDELDDGIRSRRENKDEEIRHEKQKIRDDYEAQADEVAQQAALQAKVQFKERNRSRMEREQSEVATEIDRVIESEYSRSKESILRVRKREAHLKFLGGQSKVFDYLAGEREEQLRAEEALLTKWHTRIQELIEENRKADKVQFETLREQQQNSMEIEDLRKEQEAQLSALRAEHADKVRALEDSLARATKEAGENLKLRETELLRNLEQEKGISDSLTTRVSTLTQQLAESEVAITKRSEGRIQELISDRDSLSSEMDAIQKTYRTHALVAGVLGTCGVAVFSMASLVVGMAIG